MAALNQLGLVPGEQVPKYTDSDHYQQGESGKHVPKMPLRAVNW
jgi:hypothetical protein